MPFLAGYSVKRKLVLTDDASTLTSASHYVGDYTYMSLSWSSTATTFASLLTVDGSNDDGITSSIATWSTVTTITRQGLYTSEAWIPNDVGFRWMRVARPSADSTGVVQLHGRT